MFDFFQTLWDNPGLLALLCLLPPLLTLLLAWWLLRRLRRLSSPDIAVLQQRYDQMRRADPQASPTAVMERLARRQAFVSGLVGALTSVGGVFTLPLALPLDVLLSLRIQAAMVELMARTFGTPGTFDVRVRNYLILSGGAQLTRTATNTATKLALRILEKTIVKLVPVVGLVVGFLVNYSIARATFELALRWYTNPQLAATARNLLPE